MLGVERDFGRAAGEARLLRRLGRLEIGFRRKLILAALEGDVGKEQLIEYFRSQARLRRLLRRLIRYRPRLVGNEKRRSGDGDRARKGNEGG